MATVANVNRAYNKIDRHPLFVKWSFSSLFCVNREWICSKLPN